MSVVAGRSVSSRVDGTEGLEVDGEPLKGSLFGNLRPRVWGVQGG